LTEVVNDIYKAINDFAKPEVKDTKVVVGSPQKTTLEIDWRKNYLWKVFWKRVAASLLDGLIIGIPLYVVFYAVVLGSLQSQRNDYYSYNENYLSEETALKIIFYYLLLMGVQILIYAFMESSSWRGTPGKRIMKLQITDKAGNPISFQKALLRNVIKLLIGAFSNIGDGILVIIYTVAQIVSYAQTKKFFHDQLSNTIIGERMK